MQEWKMREQTAGVENAGVENAGVYSRGGKCRSNNVWKAVGKNFMMTASQSGEKELQRLFAGQQLCKEARFDLTCYSHCVHLVSI